MIRGLKLLAAGLLCLALLAGAAAAEVTAKETVEKGRVTRVEWQDAAGNAAASPEGYAEVRYTYQNQDTTERYYNADGTPYMMQGGYYGRTVTRDGKKQITSIWYLDENGEIAANSLGYARVKMTYTSFGGIRFVGYYGADKKPVTVPSLGYAAITTEFSGKTVSSRTWEDENGKPVDNNQGFAIMKQKLNKQYQPVRTRYYHADESPATGPDGWSLCVRERDGKNRVTSIQFFDTAEKPTDQGTGFAREDIRYDGKDELTTRYDAAGNTVTIFGDAVTMLRKKDKEDRITSETYLDAAGNATEGPMGCSTVSYGYDYLGRIETVRYQNAAGESTLCSEGYAGYRDSRDEDGTIISRTYLGTDGNPMEIPGGYSEERYIYDGRKQLVETRRYNLSGNAVR